VIRPRIFFCSASSGRGKGKTRSSWISPRNRDLVKEETASPPGSCFSMVAAASMRSD
jgi:hypothetical protein